MADWARKLLFGPKPPAPEVFQRALQGDPLAEIELGEFNAAADHSGRNSRRLLAVSIFALGWVINLSYAEGLQERFSLAILTAAMLMSMFTLGVLCERYRPRPEYLLGGGPDATR